ncbi:MAG: hypothetical protein Q4B26_04810 [Eubacteriales bacterium]|nr:hypothetical protein [Eubacteriales bacterium]
MANMTAEAYLRQIGRIKREMQELEEKIEEVGGRVYGMIGISYDKDKVQTSPANRFIESFEKLDTIRTQYRKKQATLNYAQEVIRYQLATLDPLQREVLRLMFVEGVDSCYSVARIMKMRKMVIQEAKKKGLEELAKRYSKEFIRFKD